MANVQIPNLPAVASLAGEELFEGVQSGTSVKISLNQIVSAARGGTPETIPFSVDVGGTGATTLIGYVKGAGTVALTGVASIPSTDITGLGTMSTQNANNVTITGGSITGITDLAVADGGTGQGNALTQYGMIYGNTTTSMASTAAGTSTQVLHGNASGAPTFGAVSLTDDVSGVLPLANGGTGINAVSTAAVNAALMGFTLTETAAGTTTLTNTSTQYQLFIGSTTQTITLPVTSTLTTGWTFHIVNNSTLGNLTVNASNGFLVCTIIPNMTAMVTCINTFISGGAAWEFGFTDFGSITGTGAAVLGTGPTITNGVYSGTVGASNPSTGVFTSVTNDSGQLYSLRQLRIFTSGTAVSYTPTTGTKAIRVTIVGGGGGGGYVSGGGTAGTGGAAGGGGGGAVSSIVITSLSVPYTYTVGGGGAGGVGSTATVPSSGGTTTFSGGAVSLSANGGAAGVSRVASAGSNAGRGGNGGTTATGGTLNFAGQNGATGLTIAGGSSASGGDGASGPYGAGGLGLVANGANGAGDGIAASGYGAGGGGGGCFGTTAATANGGAGSGGIIIVEELG